MIDGCPPGIAIAPEDFADDLARRATGKTRHTSQRHEADEVEILSGVYEGRTTGTPIALLVRNTDARSKDYDEIAAAVPPRPCRLHLLAEVRHPRSARRRAFLARARRRCAWRRR